MAPLLRLFLLANALSCTLSSPVPYTTEDFNTSLGENDMKNIEQQRADGIDERSIREHLARETTPHKSSSERFTHKIAQFLNKLGFKDPATVTQATNAIEDKLDGVSTIKTDRVMKRDIHMIDKDSSAMSNLDMTAENEQMAAGSSAEAEKKEDNTSAGEMMKQEEVQRSPSSIMAPNVNRELESHTDETLQSEGVRGQMQQQQQQEKRESEANQEQQHDAQQHQVVEQEQELVDRTHSQRSMAMDEAKDSMIIDQIHD